jgi:uncharacterized protein YbjT (DUF2867 family)
MISEGGWVASVHVVTGAFGYSGQYIAERLLAAGHEVRTLTNSPNRAHRLHGKIDVRPLDFGDPDGLAHALDGAEAFIITYWVRFNYRNLTFAQAVANTMTLFDAAKRAGVPRVVHVSITNPSEDSPLEYFSGKARLERALRESGLSYAILRPTVLFGKEDIFINNIAWALRRFPVFGVFGDGQYRMQPIYVDDLAKLAIEQGALRENVVIDATGPETFTYSGIAEEIGKIIGKPRRILSVPPAIAYLATRAMGWFVGDVIITRDEITGLMQNLLLTDSAPAGETRLTDWARENAATLGLHYHSELARRRDRLTAYNRSR